MPKKMSEREAWLYLAEQWDNAEPAHRKKRDHIIFRHLFFCPTGLCTAIDEVICADAISYRVGRNMRSRMAKHLPRKKRTGKGHRWPTDKKGARSRAAFCRKMAKLCEKERKKKP